MVFLFLPTGASSSSCYSLARSQGAHRFGCVARASTCDARRTGALVGILVDEATVEVENIHTQMSLTDNIARRALGNAETAVPRLLAMLCILAVFLPAFFMQGSAALLCRFRWRSVLDGGVVHLSSTFVPVLSVWLLQHQHVPEDPVLWPYASTLFESGKFACAVRWPLIAVYAASRHCHLARGESGRPRDFPDRDRINSVGLRPTGTRIERTEEIAGQDAELIKDKVGPENVTITIGYVGAIPRASRSTPSTNG